MKNISQRWVVICCLFLFILFAAILSKVDCETQKIIMLFFYISMLGYNMHVQKTEVKKERAKAQNLERELIALHKWMQKKGIK